MEESLQEMRERIDLTNPDEVQKMNTLERTLKKAMLTKSLGENDAVLMLRATLQDRINLCDKVLSNDETLDDQTRRDIFTRKRTYKWFLNLFTMAEKRVDNIEEVINKNLGGKRSKK